MLILPSLSSLSHFLDSRQQELTKAHRLLDLPEHRLDHLLAQPIAAAMAGAPELGGHPGEERAGLGRPLGDGRRGSVLWASGRDVAFDPSPAERAKIGRRAVPASADTSSGLLPRLTLVASSKGANCAWSLPLLACAPR
jgi:hypothetical protein